VGWFGRSTRAGQAAQGTQARQVSHKPTRGERRAAARTAKAEAALQETEQRIHQLADQTRDELRGSA